MRTDDAQVSSVRGWRGLVSGACLLGLVAGSVSVAVPAANAEDDRDTVANQLDASESRLAELRASLEGIDANIAKVYLELDGLETQIPLAEEDLRVAHERFETATREHEAAQAQLEAAQGERQRLQDDIADAKSVEKDARAAMNNYARTLYQEGNPSALSVILTDEDAGDISRRVAAVESMTRLQNAALSSALNVQERTKSQVLRQEAVTARITELETQARQLADQAHKAETDAQNKVDKLEGLKNQATEKKKLWESQKAAAAAQLQRQEAEHQAMEKKLAEIDARNRELNFSYFESGSSSAYTSASGFSFPLRVGMIVTSPYGWRVHPVLGTSRLHNGTDFAANCGTPVYASVPGVVSDVTFEEAGGNVVYVNHGLKNGNSYTSAYVHLQATNVYPGQSVNSSTVIGWVGTTGYSTGCHLHFTVYQNGATVDPMAFL